MFTKLIGWLYGCFIAFVQWFGVFWRWMSDFSRMQWWIAFTVIGGVVASLKTAYTALASLDTMLNSALSSAGSAAGGHGGGGGVGGGGANDALAFINYLFPVNETFGYFLAYVEISAALIAYRFLKSWLPKVLGTGVG